MTGIGQVVCSRRDLGRNCCWTEHSALRPVRAVIPIRSTRACWFTGPASNFHRAGLMEASRTRPRRPGSRRCASTRAATTSWPAFPRSAARSLARRLREHRRSARHDLTAWIGLLGERGYRRDRRRRPQHGGRQGQSTRCHGSRPITSPASWRSRRHDSSCSLSAAQTRGSVPRRLPPRRCPRVARRRGKSCCRFRQPMSLVMPASGFVAKYGPHDEYDIVKLLPARACPTLVLIGTESAKMLRAFDGLPAESRTHGGRSPRAASRHGGGSRDQLTRATSALRSST